MRLKYAPFPSVTSPDTASYHELCIRKVPANFLRRLTWCYVPKRIPTVLVSAICSFVFAEFQWFENRWISDVENTMVGKGWEKLEKADPVAYEKLRTKVYGKMEWHVAGGIITVIQPGINPFNETYTYRYDEDGIPEVMTNSGSIIKVRKTETGFCVDHENGNFMTNECFKPVGT